MSLRVGRFAARTHVARPACALVPIDRPAQTVLERRPSIEAEQLLGAARIQRAAWLTVRLRGIPPDFAVESCQLHDLLDELANRDFRPDAEVLARATLIPRVLWKAAYVIVALLCLWKGVIILLR